ncbi:MAG TPA: HAMP domain-containing sensor histidine kinase [Candidatus Limnocylindrales bacterium]|nr:HAMP domain-containing sensor histidine kinase [Candidatus Limnocylindrales bacterium]
MIPRSLRGRLIASYVALALVLLVAVGGTLFVVLRGLHADAASGSLADVAGSVLPQVRQSVGSGNLRGTLDDVGTQLATRDISVMLVGTDGRLHPIGGQPVGDAIMQTDGKAGDTIRGSVVLDGQPYLYAATVIRRTAAAAPRAVAFLTADRSGALALGDLGRAIPAVALVILLVAAPLAWLVARSVTRPLERVADAASDLPVGSATTLALEGPSEVRALTGTFNAMSGELADTRRREAELLADLRHDLRTPLTVISGFAAALVDGTAAGDDVGRAGRAIGEEADRLERLVGELATIDGLRSGENPLRPEQIDAESCSQRHVIASLPAPRPPASTSRSRRPL